MAIETLKNANPPVLVIDTATAEKPLSPGTWEDICIGGMRAIGQVGFVPWTPSQELLR